MKIPACGSAGGLLQDINDDMGIAIGDSALKLAEPLFIVFGTPVVAAALEFVDADGFWDFCNRIKWTISKIDWSMDGVMQFCRVLSKKERSCVRARRKHRALVSCAWEGGFRKILVEGGAAYLAAESTLMGKMVVLL